MARKKSDRIIVSKRDSAGSNRSCCSSHGYLCRESEFMLISRGKNKALHGRRKRTEVDSLAASRATVVDERLVLLDTHLGGESWQRGNASIS